jgi:colanic acid biosynthesis glycosyl transferase WcaI
MRILYLSPYFWPEEIGSAPYCTDLALWLRDSGHEVYVVAFRPHYPSAQLFLDWADGSHDRDQLDGVQISRVPVAGRGGGGFKDRLKNDLAFLRHVLRATIGGKFRGTDVVVAYVPSTLTLYGAFAVRLTTGARIVAVVHDIESGLAKTLGIATGSSLSFLMRLAERIGLNRAERVVALTEGMRDELRAIGCRRPVEVLSIWAAPPPAAATPPEGATVVMYSGNFGRKQNLEQLLPVFKRLCRENPAIRILLRGDGQEWAHFKSRVDDARITNADFLPLVPAADFMNCLRAAHIHLVPQAENVANYSIPSKVFSIMASGRPFISIASPGSPLDALARSSGAGICVAPKDDEALYCTISDLANDLDRQRRMGEAGRHFVDTHMNKQLILNAYEKLICA